jgi:hypothetical protein
MPSKETWEQILAAGIEFRPDDYLHINFDRVYEAGVEHNCFSLWEIEALYGNAVLCLAHDYIATAPDVQHVPEERRRASRQWLEEFWDKDVPPFDYYLRLAELHQLKIVNLMEYHICVLVKSSQRTVSYPPSGKQLSLLIEEIPGSKLEDYPFEARATGTFKRVVGLPDPEPNTVYIVPESIAAAVPYRTDLMCPGNPILDAEGQTIALDYLKRVTK